MDFYQLAIRQKGHWPSTIDKAKILTLPIFELNNIPVKIITVEDELKEVIQKLNKSKVIGFDTETKPVFIKGNKNNIALIQLATTDYIYLIRTCILKPNKAFWELLESPNIIKVGIGLGGDLKQLRGLNSQLLPSGFLDLSKVAELGGITTSGLRNLVAIFLNKRLPKTFQTSNWEGELSPGQIAYAAKDALACLVLYERIKAEFESLPS